MGKPFLALNERNRERVVFPVRDLNPIHNYRPDMWRRIREHFRGEPRVAVEVGSRRGAFAAGLMENTRETILFCVDSWVGRQGMGNLAAWLKRLEPWAFRRAFPLKGTSGDWSKIFPFQPDLIFVDAEHDRRSAAFDIRSWSGLLSDGGLLIGHDCNQGSVAEAVRDVFPDREVTTFHSGPQKAHSFIIPFGEVR